MPQLRPSPQSFSFHSQTKQSTVRSSSWENKSRPIETTDQSETNYKDPTTNSINQKHNPADLINHTLDWQHGCAILDYNKNNRKKTYKANRLHEIRHTTTADDWKYIPTKHVQSTKEPEESRQQNSNTRNDWMDQFSSCLHIYGLGLSQKPHPTP